MDIHRCRFVSYPPQPINALAFSHASDTKNATQAGLRLAVGRESGDIEIWNPNGGSWAQEKTLYGSAGRTIEQLAWTQDLILIDENGVGGNEPSDGNGTAVTLGKDAKASFENGPLRLFSSGGSRSLTEWDLNTGVQKCHADSNSGDIWCFAAQPQWTRPLKEKKGQKGSGKKHPSNSAITAAPSQLLAAGCADGSIILFNTADDELRYDRIVVPGSTKNSKVISITWRDRNTIVAGYEKSSIRLVDVRNRQVVREMSLGKSTDGGHCLVWTVKCLPDGTLISGDSSGELKVWDSKNFSLVQRLKTHEADVLDLTTNAAGDMIYSCGVDRRTIAYRPVATQGGNRMQRWEEVQHRRFHQHDVKAIVAYESRDISVAVCGGMDAAPVILPLRNWDSEYHRQLSHLPQQPPLSCSARSRLMLLWWAQDLYVWRLPKRQVNYDLVQEAELDAEHRKLVGSIQLQGDENISSAQISNDGRMVIAATSASVRLFQIHQRVKAGQVQIRTRQIELPVGIKSFGASSVGFSPDSKWIYAVRLSNVTALAKIIWPASTSSSVEKPQVYEKVTKLSRRARLSNPSRSAKLAIFGRAISSVAFSSDGRVLAVGDMSGAVDTWLLEGHEALEEAVLNNGVYPTSSADASSESASDSDSDSDDDSDDETETHAVQGQKWTRTPSGSQLPQLNSAILTLSFKPTSTPQEDLTNTNGNLGLHATRHNPHPTSHELPDSRSGFLVAITAKHQIIEFDVLNCKLSDWSRRNPSTNLPAEFTQIKDRVKGAWWDCNAKSGYDRLWTYGPSWLFMLDLSRDLDMAKALPSQKVGKIGNYDVLGTPLQKAIIKSNTDHSGGSPLGKKRKRDTGAGSEMAIRHRSSATIGSTTNPSKTVDNLETESDDDDEEEEEDGEQSATDQKQKAQSLLARMRRSGNAFTSSDDLNMTDANLTAEDAVNELVTPRSVSSDSALQLITEHQEHQKQEEEKENSRGPLFWHTFQYRFILGAGVVDTDSPTSSNADNHDQVGGQKSKSRTEQAADNLEVVIVECPLTSLELGPRFAGGQD